jgi:AcrR family transcriptional regulator
VSDTRTRLLTATNELFRQWGYRGTSLKKITAAAGAPVGSLYHFFPGGKDELTRAVITTTGEAYRQLFEAIADEAGNAADAVENFFDGAAEVLEQTGYIDPCPIGTIAREVASTNADLRTATDSVFGSWIGALSSRFQSEGLTHDIADELATTVVAALEGGFVLARVRHDAELMRIAGRHVRRLIEVTISAADRIRR